MRGAVACLLVSVALLGAACSAQPQALALQVLGDAIPEPLSATPGDAARGREIVASRQSGLCLLCHTGPFPEDKFQGNLAPDLAGAGSRWSAGQLRLRIADARRLNPQTVMPAYHRSERLNRVGPAGQGKTLLSAMTAAEHVSGIAVFNDRNPQRDVVRFTLGPRSGRAVVSTRMRLATSQQLVAVARMSDGTYWSHAVDVLVTLAACLE